MAVTKSQQADSKNRSNHEDKSPNDLSNLPLSGSKAIEVIGTGKYPLVPLSAIEFAERPTSELDSEILFFNPRSLNSFSPEKMASIRNSIRGLGLLEPPVCRAWVDDSGAVLRIQLIAGERRVRSLMHIVDQNLPCFDENAVKKKTYQNGEFVALKGRIGTVVRQEGDYLIIDFESETEGSSPTREKYLAENVLPAVLGSELYSHIPCKLFYSCTDERALQIAFAENDQSEPLTIQEEIALVERLMKRGLKLEDISKIISKNVTWISQTANFRSELPNEAFRKLMCQEMTRHVAVGLLSHKPEDRTKLFEAMIEIEKQQTAEKINNLTDQRDIISDEKELIKGDLNKAFNVGNEEEVNRKRKKLQAADNKERAIHTQLIRANEENGVIKQGHIKSAQELTGISPKKIKPLDRKQIENLIKQLTPYSINEKEDPVTGELVPENLASVARRTLIAVIAGQTDPLAAIRDYHFDNGLWENPNPEEQENQEEQESQEGK